MLIFSRSEAGNVIKTHEHAGDFKEAVKDRLQDAV
jgi:hypothetical protein